MGRVLRLFLQFSLLCLSVLWIGFLTRTAEPGAGILESDRLLSAAWFALFALLLANWMWRDLRPTRPRTGAEPNTIIAYRYGWFERQGYLASGIVTLLVSLLMALNGDDTRDTSSSGMMFGLAAVWLVRGIWDVRRKSGVALTLSPEGLEFREFPCGLIPWEQIKAVTLRDIVTANIAVTLRDQYAHKEMPDWEHRGLIIRCGRFDTKPEELLAEIQARLDAFGSPAAVDFDSVTPEPSLRTTT